MFEHTQQLKVKGAEQAARSGLLDRRRRLEGALAAGAPVDDLLEAVDAALERLEGETLGRCERCHEEIEAERLAVEPMLRICLDCLDEGERRALERDLDLAGGIQTSLLPEREMSLDGWEGHYIYEPQGAVSGDYVDLLERDHDTIAIVGDVAGKGVAAALLMSHLHALFRSMAHSDCSLVGMVERANRLFCASTPSQLFATLVAARLEPGGRVEVCSAGHVPSMVLNGGVTPVASHGLPLGLFCDSRYTSTVLELNPSESLVLYTDGVTESTDHNDEELGVSCLRELLEDAGAPTPRRLAEHCVERALRHRGGRPATDDLTVMVLQRRG
jgi:sigma-B regulation protein RsbU (phosphoserine phosphatase)